MASPEILRCAQEARSRAYKLSSWRRQASQPVHKGSSFKPEVTSSRIFEPGYKRTSPRAGVQATRIKVFFGCFTWKDIWCGERRILLPNVTFNSIVIKVPEGVAASISGVPDKLRFSSLLYDIDGIFFLRSRYNFTSGFMKVTWKVVYSLPTIFGIFQVPVNLTPLKFKMCVSLSPITLDSNN